jgi:RNA polymerase sigma-70 factor, ECF subfamily
MPARDDRALVAAILGGDRAALARLVRREHAWLIRLARAIVGRDALAEEAAQDAWIAIIRSLPSFEGRCSLRSWMATIVRNRAKTTARRDARVVTASPIGTDTEDDQPTVDPTRFGVLGTWVRAPGDWDADTPETILGRKEAVAAILTGLESLPANQRMVLTLRDMEGWSSEEVCNALAISESNQRVLLHRGRAKIRATLERVLERGAKS